MSPNLIERERERERGGRVACLPKPKQRPRRESVKKHQSTI